MTGRIEFFNGIEMYDEIYGQGEPVVLLHGFTGSSANWSVIGKALSKEYQIIVPDMRGHGRSTNNSSRYTFQEVAFDIYALLDHLEIKTFNCMGCSGGGNALLHMATQQPDRINSMILVSATSYYPEQARTIMRQTSTEHLSGDRWQELRKLHVREDSQIRELYEHAKAFATDYLVGAQCSYG